MRRGTVLAALGVLCLLSSGCFGCFAVSGVGKAYLENREEFNVCLVAAREAGKGDEIRAILLDGPDERSVGDLKALATELADVGLEEECGPVVEILQEEAADAGQTLIEQAKELPRP